MNNKKELITISLFVAILYLLGMIQIPIGPVPITLQTLGIMLTGTLLDSKKAFIVTLIYALLLSNHIVGPTGGYILSFPIAALMISSLKKYNLYIALLIGGIILPYLIGVPYLKYYLNISYPLAISYGFTPYIIGDVFKLVVATLITQRLHKILPLIYTKKYYA